MILYKYVPFDSGKTILETCAIGFSQPMYFNDPFDLPSYPRDHQVNPLHDLTGKLRRMAKDQVWRENTAILSLTRTPVNPLMWAHYAHNHQGLVIGIDVIKAGLTDEKSNLIPAQYGSVIYVSRRAENPFISKPETALAVGATYHFAHDHYEKLQRLFLHKPLCWSYEEEVRVVKCIKGIPAEGGDVGSGRFDIVTVNARNLYSLSLPQDAIAELYFGFKTDLQIADDLFYQVRRQYPSTAIYDCNLDSSNFSVGFVAYKPNAESAA